MHTWSTCILPIMSMHDQNLLSLFLSPTENQYDGCNPVNIARDTDNSTTISTKRSSLVSNVTSMILHCKYVHGMSQEEEESNYEHVDLHVVAGDEATDVPSSESLCSKKSP